MTESKVPQVVREALSNVAPEVDLDAIDSAKNLRDQMDIGSVDFLNFVIGQHKELGVEILDADVPKLVTLTGCIEYLTARVKRS